MRSSANQESDVLSYLQLPTSTAAAFHDAASAPARTLDLVLRYERGEWSTVSTQARALGISEERVPEFFRDAVGWANRLAVRRASTCHSRRIRSPVIEVPMRESAHRFDHACA